MKSISKTSAVQFKNVQRLVRKATVLYLLGSALFCKQLGAQTRSIRFESGSWTQIKTRAAETQQVIFLDGYASWCGICKKMDKNVFSNDSVAEYFNRRFVNARFDMESGEGLALAKQYRVNLYPTLLFIDAQGQVLHRAEGGLQSRELMELAREAEDPEKQNKGKIHENAEGQPDEGTDLNRVETGFHISQFQKDFGIGLQLLSPYFFFKSVAIKAAANFQWLEYSNGSETTFSPYQNFQLGMRGRSNVVTHHIAIYGEGGVLLILPGTDFSSQRSVIGGYGLFGFEFRILPRMAYFIELGGVGTGATADKVLGKPIYSNGFLLNVGMTIGL